MIRKINKLATLVLAISFSVSCVTAEVGSERWCEKLKNKLDDELTIEGSKDYAKHCLLKIGNES